MAAASDVLRFRVAVAVLAGLVLVQAALAGQFLTSSRGAMTPHRLIGEGLGLVALGVVWAGYRLRVVERERWWLSLCLLVLVVAQTGLGFAGRDSTAAASLHVPVGVLTFGVALVGVAPRLRA